jgi:hypothetical protein
MRTPSARLRKCVRAHERAWISSARPLNSIVRSTVGDVPRIEHFEDHPARGRPMAGIFSSVPFERRNSVSGRSSESTALAARL